jgi:hypothetical protein
VLAIGVKLKKNPTAYNMFKRHDITLMSSPSCDRAVENIEIKDFIYYDKDGFELNIAEQKFYKAMDFPIHYPILNHTCWQEPWFELESNMGSIMLDHSMFLCRANYIGSALDQLYSIKPYQPLADYLIRTPQQWGFDFALDAVIDNTPFEVLHIEYDNYDYERFCERMMHFDYMVRHTDWRDAANRVWNHRNKWQHLQGFDQNHWKAEFLLGWKRSEHIEKSFK